VKLVVEAVARSMRDGVKELPREIEWQLLSATGELKDIGTQK
jgi:hypothetical protein